MAAAGEEPRTYGGWRPRRGLGLFGLSTGQTAAVLGAIAVLLVMLSVAPPAVLVLGPPLLVGTGLLIARWDGVPVTHLILRRWRWWWATGQGWTRSRAGVLVDHPHAWDLPGVLAPLRLVTAADGLGGEFGLVWDRRTGLLTATLRVAATSIWLAGKDGEGWVANWGGWLAGLGLTPAVRHVAVTVDTAPETGSRLREQLAQQVDPAAPPLARALVDELVAVSPAAAADVETRVSISFDPALSPDRPRDLMEAAAEFGRLLTGLESSLGTCGVTVLGRVSAPGLAAAVRQAFDPAARGELRRLAATDPSAQTGAGTLSWAQAGPVAAEEAWDRYTHDSGVSVSWAWREAPLQAVRATVLARLIAPGRDPKRVTLLYRPLSAAAAARVLEAEVSAAAVRALAQARTGRDTSARDRADAERAARAAREEAIGAGVVLMSLYVTVTVPAEQADEQLRRAVADVESRAGMARIRLRRSYGAQAAGFAVGLPCGISPPTLAGRWPH